MVEPDITFVIVNWNTRELLLQCLHAIHETSAALAIEIIVVDNGSSDDSLQAAQRLFPSIRCIANNENRGFAAANNQAFQAMRGRYALLINTDATVLPGSVDALLTFMEARPDVGMACGQLLNTDGSKQNAFAAFPSLLSLMVNESLLKLLLPQKFPSKYREYSLSIEVDSCIGACMIVRKRAMDQVGFFDERYFFFFEETDWARQFWQKGWRVCFVPDARIVHAQGQSAGASALARRLFYHSRYQYLLKWHPRSFNVMKAMIGIRLAVDTLFNALATLLTLGMHSGTRNRCKRYLKLLTWHVQGCPSPVPDITGERRHA